MIPVAITQRLIENSAYPETRDCLDVRWAALCERLGLLPIVLPTHAPPEAYFDALGARGVILSGGNDVSSVTTDRLSRIRDEHEARVLAIARAHRLPVLAFCRGMQFIAQSFGAMVERVSGHASGERHTIDVDASTSFGSGLRGRETVASYHGFGIRQPPVEFDVVATAHDGVVEAMEHRSQPIVCAMWHPEREATWLEREMEFYRTFLAGATQ